MKRAYTTSEENNERVAKVEGWKQRLGAWCRFGSDGVRRGGAIAGWDDCGLREGDWERRLAQYASLVR